MEWGWQDCQSLPTRTLHQQWNLTLGKGSELSRISTLSTTVLKTLPHFRLAILHCRSFLTQGKTSCVSRRGILFLFWSHAARRREALSIVIHIFPQREESGVFAFVFGIWCKSSLTHWVLCCCYSCSKLGAVRSLSPTIFLWRDIFTLRDYV